MESCRDSDYFPFIFADFTMTVWCIFLKKCDACNCVVFSPSGNVRNISPAVWSLQHLTSLYLNDNSLSRIPSEIAQLQHLMYLDLSCNKIRSLPAEIGELTRLRLVPQNYLFLVLIDLKINAFTLLLIPLKLFFLVQYSNSHSRTDSDCSRYSQYSIM